MVYRWFFVLMIVNVVAALTKVQASVYDGSEVLQDHSQAIYSSNQYKSQPNISTIRSQRYLVPQ